MPKTHTRGKSIFISSGSDKIWCPHWKSEIRPISINLQLLATVGMCHIWWLVVSWLLALSYLREGWRGGHQSTWNAGGFWLSKTVYPFLPWTNSSLSSPLSDSYHKADIKILYFPFLLYSNILTSSTCTAIYLCLFQFFRLLICSFHFLHVLCAKEITVLLICVSCTVYLNLIYAASLWP